MKFTFFATALPAGEVEVRVWPDVATQACNDMYIPPARSAVVTLPSGGSMEVVLEGADFAATGVLMVQITPTLNTPVLGTVDYDATSAATKLELTCLPAAGTSSCV